MNDIICARITAPGRSAIAVIRISGKGAIELVSEFFSPRQKLLKAPGNSIVYGNFHDDSGRIIDEVLLSVFRAPHSYTAEDTIELSCHGNPALAERILSTLLTKARLANPGEYTLRAYLNGRMDLSQAEAVNDLITAESSKAETAALMQIKGYLGRHLSNILERIRDARLRCELAIDFADQDLPQIDLDDLKRRIQQILKDAKDLYAEGSGGIKLREGVKICLAGAPNTGKSSLFNALLKQNRAIVTPHPGTTRDYLEESFSLNGYPIVLWDTAGLRDSEDSIEQEGIARSYSLMRKADLILLLYEGEYPGIGDELSNFVDKIIPVASKADIISYPALPEDHVKISVKLKDGLVDLSEKILQRLSLPTQIIDRPLITNSRHLAALHRSITSLQDALTALDMNAGFEIIAFELITAASALEEILGVLPTDELLNKIFSEFCIGK
nr:tRNA modification GTPase [Candidatus Cloacimonadota bacterium]